MAGGGRFGRKRHDFRQGTAFQSSRDACSVVFQPGSLGVAFDGQGNVTKVLPGCQFQIAGISAGWRIRNIDGHPFTATLLKKFINGGLPYTITFLTPDGQGLVDSRYVVFRPGRLGVRVDSDGLIVEVRHGSQAQVSGVLVGWAFHMINGRVYTESTLNEHALGNQPYRVTFTKVNAGVSVLDAGYGVSIGVLNALEAGPAHPIEESEHGDGLSATDAQPAGNGTVPLRSTQGTSSVVDKSPGFGTLCMRDDGLVCFHIHRHLLARRLRINSICNLCGRQGTAYCCNEACDFDVCQACWEHKMPEIVPVAVEEQKHEGHHYVRARADNQCTRDVIWRGPAKGWGCIAPPCAEAHGKQTFSVLVRRLEPDSVIRIGWIASGDEDAAGVHYQGWWYYAATGFGQHGWKMNQGKLQRYGDFFREGDVLTAVITWGRMAFMKNHIDQGCAFQVSTQHMYRPAVALKRGAQVELLTSHYAESVELETQGPWKAPRHVRDDDVVNFNFGFLEDLRAVFVKTYGKAAHSSPRDSLCRSLYVCYSQITRCLSVKSDSFPHFMTAVPSNVSLWIPAQCRVGWEEEQAEEHRSVTICVSASAFSEIDMWALSELMTSWAASQRFPCNSTLSGLKHELDAAQVLDAHFSDILCSLQVSPVDMDDLLRRGLEPAEIREIGLKTWPGGMMKVPAIDTRDDIPSLQHIYVGQGLLIPARAPSGLINALYIKLRSEKDSDGPKQKWVGHGGSFKLPFGHEGCEDPLFNCPASAILPKSVVFVGGGLKAYVFRHLAARVGLDVHVVGSPGGRFYRSPEGVISAISCVQAREVVMYPDAGAIENYEVLLAHFRTFHFLTVELGLKVRIGWYGQRRRDPNLDPDDILRDIASQSRAIKVGHLSISGFWRKVPASIRSACMDGRYWQVFEDVLPADVV